MTFADLGRILIVIPTYNEWDNLAGVVRRVRASVPEADILVADDASPDGTGQLADELASVDNHVHVMHRSGKQGLGRAYVAGFSWARGNGYDVLVEMDADGSHAPEELPRLLAALRNADLVLGSRWIPGGDVRNWPRTRRWLSRGGNRYARVALRLPLADSTGGYRAFRAEVIDNIELSSVASQGYCFQVDLAWRAHRKGYRVVEVPITFVERASGVSKMSRAIVAEALFRVTVWGVQSRFRRRRDREPALSRL